MTLLEFLIKIYTGKKVIKKNLIIILLSNFIAIIIIILNYTSLQQSDTKTIVFKNVPINIERDIYQNLDFRQLVMSGLVIKVEKDELGFDVWDHIFISPENIEIDSTAERINELIFFSLKANKKYLSLKTVTTPKDNYLLYNILKYEKDNLNKKNFHVQPSSFRLQKIISIFIQSNIFAIILIFIFRIKKLTKL